MLAGTVFTDNQISYSIWSDYSNPNADGNASLAAGNSIVKAHLRRLRRMQTQNFIQRAAFEVVSLLKPNSEVA